MEYVGMDPPSTVSQVCIVAERGQVVSERRVRTHGDVWDGDAVLRRLRGGDACEECLIAHRTIRL